MTNRCAGFCALAQRAPRSYGAVAALAGFWRLGAGGETLRFTARGGPISLVANSCEARSFRLAQPITPHCEVRAPSLHVREARWRSYNAILECLAFWRQ